MNAKKSILFEAMKAEMPSTKAIADAGLDSLALRRDLTPEIIKKSFSSLLKELEDECYALYLKEEERIGELTLRDFLNSSEGEKIFPALNKFFLALSQSRKARAGGTFEGSIAALLKRCEYSFEEQPIINGKPDFVLPSKAHYQLNAPDCIVLTAKRTLRERWRQIATEGIRGKRALFLATLDDGLSDTQLKEMLANGIYLVVPEPLKEGKPAYSTNPNVISFESFFLDHLDPAMARWKRNKVLDRLG